MNHCKPEIVLVQKKVVSDSTAVRVCIETDIEMIKYSYYNTYS